MLSKEKKDSLFFCVFLIQFESIGWRVVGSCYC